MRRLGRLVLGVLVGVPVVLFPGLAGFAPQGGTALVAAQAACASPLTPGTWTGTFDWTERRRAESIKADITWANTGTLQLEVACSGRATGSLTFTQVVTIQQPEPPDLPAGSGRATCTTPDVDVRVDGVTMRGDLTDLGLEVSGTTKRRERATCTRTGMPFGFEGPRGIPVSILFSNGQLSGTTVRGDDMAWTAPEQWIAFWRRLAGPPDTTATWVLEGPPAPSPTSSPRRITITGLQSQYEKLFLQGVGPLLNRFTASVDWGDGPAGTVEFSLGGTRRRGTAGASGSYSAEFDLETLRAGTNVLVVTAQRSPTDGDMTSRDVVIVDRPQWGDDLDWKAIPAQSIVLYTARVKAPEPAFDRFAIDINDSIPVIGGRWGLSPTQFEVTLAVDSTGASRTARKVTATGGIALGSESVDLRPRSQVKARLDASALTFESGTVTADLARPLTYEDKVGLGSLIPGWDSITSGDSLLARGLRRLEPGIGIRLSADASVEGKLGLVDGGQRLDFEEARGTLRLGAGGVAGVDLGTYTVPSWLTGGAPVTIDLSAGVSVEIRGDATARFVPQTAFEACSVDLEYVLWAGTSRTGDTITIGTCAP